MTTELLRNTLAALMGWDPETLSSRELLMTPACHGYSPRQATGVILGLRGSAPRYPLSVSNMYYDWTQRVVVDGDKRVPNGARKQMICALIDRHLVAAGYDVNQVTPYPPMHLLPKAVQGLKLPHDFG